MERCGLVREKKMKPIRKVIKEFLTDNPDSSGTSVVAACESEGYKSARIYTALIRMEARGIIVRTGDNYSIA